MASIWYESKGMMEQSYSEKWPHGGLLLDHLGWHGSPKDLGLRLRACLVRFSHVFWFG